jgi:cell division protein FtsQ
MAKDYYSRKIPNQKLLLRKKRFLKPKEIKKIIFTSLHFILFLSLILIVSILLNHLLKVIVQSSYFSLKDIRFEGCKKVTPLELMKLTQIKEGSNLFTINLRELAQRLNSNPWIKDVKVKRIFPHTLKIKVNERIPVALVNHKKLFLVDKEGILFKEVEPGDDIDMPVITGLSFSEPSSKLIKKALALLEIADKTGVLPKDRISEIHIDNNYGFTLYTLKKAIPIRFGFQNYREKLSLLASIQKDLCNRQIDPEAIYFISKEVAHVKLATSS